MVGIGPGLILGSVLAFAHRDFENPRKPSVIVAGRVTIKYQGALKLHFCKVVNMAVAELVEALRYKSEGRGFDFRWCHWNFSLT